MNISLRTRISLASVILTTLALAVGAWLVDSTLTERFVGERQATLQAQARLLAVQVEPFLGRDGPRVRELTADLASLLGVRALVLDQGGRAVADSAGLLAGGEILRLREVDLALSGQAATRVFRHAEEGWIPDGLPPGSGGAGAAPLFQRHGP